MKARGLLSAWTAVCLAGCAAPAPPQGRADLLDFLADGRTGKRQVLERLGEPSGNFEGGKVLTYRLAYESANKGYRVVGREVTESGWPKWLKAKYSLVLVFEGGVLRKHSLVEVN